MCLHFILTVFSQINVAVVVVINKVAVVIILMIHMLNYGFLMLLKT